MISLTLDIDPTPKGRPRFTRTGHVFTPKRTRDFETRLAWLARNQYKGKPLSGPIELRVTFYMRAPKKRVRTFPSVKPDLDNLIKCKDALNGILWEDDAQIVRLNAQKVYSSGAGQIHMDVFSV